MNYTFGDAAPKKRVNPDANNAQAEAVKEKREAWLEANKGAIKAYNKLIEQDGKFSEDLRSF